MSRYAAHITSLNPDTLQTPNAPNSSLKRFAHLVPSHQRSRPLTYHLSRPNKSDKRRLSVQKAKQKRQRPSPVRWTKRETRSSPSGKSRLPKRSCRRWRTTATSRTSRVGAAMCCSTSRRIVISRWNYLGACSESKLNWNNNTVESGNLWSEFFSTLNSPTSDTTGPRVCRDQCTASFRTISWLFIDSTCFSPLFCMISGRCLAKFQRGPFADMIRRCHYLR